MGAKTARTHERGTCTAAAAARAEVVEILAGAVFTLLLEGRFAARGPAEQQHSNSVGNTGTSLSESPCLVDQRTPSCPSTAAPASRRKEAET